MAPKWWSNEKDPEYFFFLLYFKYELYPFFDVWHVELPLEIITINPAHSLTIFIYIYIDNFKIYCTQNTIKDR